MGLRASNRCKYTILKELFADMPKQRSYGRFAEGVCFWNAIMDRLCTHRGK